MAKNTMRKELLLLTLFTFVVLGLALALETRMAGAVPPGPPSNVEAFRRTLSLTLDRGAREAKSSFEIPRGKRLILEFATASVAAPASTRFRARVLTQGSGEDILDHRLGLAPGERPGTLQAVQPLRAFADAGTTVTVALDRPAFGEASAAVATLFGYLIDVP